MRVPIGGEGLLRAESVPCSQQRCHSLRKKAQRLDVRRKEETQYRYFNQVLFVWVHCRQEKGPQLPWQPPAHHCSSAQEAPLSPGSKAPEVPRERNGLLALARSTQRNPEESHDCGKNLIVSSGWVGRHHLPPSPMPCKQWSLATPTFGLILSFFCPKECSNSRAAVPRGCRCRPP